MKSIYNKTSNTLKHKWNFKNNGEGGVESSSVACIKCGCVKQYIGGKPTYFYNDSVFYKAPICKPQTPAE